MKCGKRISFIMKPGTNTSFLFGGEPNITASELSQL